MVKKRRYIDHYSIKDEDLIGFYKKEDKKKEYEILLKGLHRVLIACAKLLIDHGVSVNDLTTKNDMSPLFLAASSHSFELAEWLIGKSPHSI